MRAIANQCGLQHGMIGSRHQNSGQYLGVLIRNGDTHPAHFRHRISDEPDLGLLADGMRDHVSGPFAQKIRRIYRVGRLFLSLHPPSRRRDAAHHDGNWEAGRLARQGRDDHGLA